MDSEMRQKKNTVFFFFLFSLTSLSFSFAQQPFFSQDASSSESPYDYPLPSNPQPQTPLNPIQYHSSSPQENPIGQNPSKPQVYGQQPAKKSSPSNRADVEFSEELPDPTNGLKPFLDSLNEEQRKTIEKKFRRDAIHAFVGRTDTLDKSYLLFAEKTPKNNETLILVFISKKNKIHYLFSSFQPFSIPPQIRLNPYDRLSLSLSVIRFEMSQTTPEIFTQTAVQQKKEAKKH
ncbi:hypothetical protein A7K93_07115 [Candidatus Methylacidiphilum fumarolicum]|uniref:Uncharacterized protein n=2 Tax=Candidatus Methylacidiphilum fumarolicum TaxID=591154 RepID=I0JVY9_METFB|nr:hypothetical protein [Candidatus Methylacidiphilum fumarolicum]MBW6415554.1 hypothetical protein [Candidatus Methylacidiphilum fumarolicum]TFE68445.1 hypothetical protein A7K73_07705 [Candidatus Methylacidiphilum fumarolicum]TFE73053.1 hypothetical protein A7K93_07115 [Candidatus Methylacidiphilum fumarolicum]TFE73110.1 hypothetical protein A7K72_07145 [Candidatus Methylacidiphilum fumarolicum]TFE77099.1 hypothetical protein A7D33_06680 [Candidatus Methylacidiphilum fumarolicum]